ncbi:MAG: TolC family protein [bacterium]
MKRLWILTFVFLAFPPRLHAQQTSKALKWDDCVQITIVNNPDIASAQGSLGQSKAQQKGSYGEFFPQLSFNTGYNTTNTINTFSGNSPQSFQVSGGSDRQWTTGVSLKQNFFAGLASKARVDQAKADLSANEWNLEVVKANISYNLRNAFSQLLFSQKQILLTQEIEKRRKENVRLVELRYQGGGEDKGAFLRSQATYDQAAFETQQAKRGLETAQRQLATVMGQPQWTGLKVTGDFKVNKPGPEPDYVSLAERTPTHYQKFSQSQSAEAGVRVTRGNLMPSVDGNASFNHFSNNNQGDRDQWTAGINLTYPFFNGTKNVYDYKAAKFQRLKTTEDLRSSDNQGTSTLQSTFAQWKDAVQQVEVEKSLLKAAQVRAEIARAKYNNGLLTFQDWDLIESDLITQEKSMLANLRDAVIAEANWFKAQGKGVFP